MAVSVSSKIDFHGSQSDYNTYPASITFTFNGPVKEIKLESQVNLKFHNYLPVFIEALQQRKMMAYTFAYTMGEDNVNRKHCPMMTIIPYRNILKLTDKNTDIEIDLTEHLVDQLGSELVHLQEKWNANFKVNRSNKKIKNSE
jgi:hypothetical protein